jgi:hypothetical protein
MPLPYFFSHPKPNLAIASIRIKARREENALYGVKMETGNSALV